MVRPSYVLGGRGMEVVYDPENLTKYMDAAVGVTPDRPILIDRFLNHAMECEADAISDGTHAFVPAVMEHIELAGVHSGDSACIIPSRHISEKNVKTIKEYTRKIAEEMGVKGLMNMQYAIENDKVYVLEANPRASRTVPLVSKVCNIRMVPLAIDIVTSELTGRPSPVPGLKEKNIPYYGVKESVFPFNMFQEVDPVLGPEMRSTGEVLGLSEFYGEAFFKAQEATQTKLPMSGTVLISVCDKDKAELPEVAKGFADAGFHILATKGTQKVLADAGVPVHFIEKLSDTEQLCRKTSVIPMEVIVRNVIAGSMAQRLGLKEGIVPSEPVYDICYKSEELGDPIINDYHAVVLGLVTKEELAEIYEISKKVNDVLRPVFDKAGIILVDFKIELGRLPDGSLVVSDEITPDSARFWDKATGEKLDKDRFRQDSGKVGAAYRTVYERLGAILNK